MFNKIKGMAGWRKEKIRKDGCYETKCNAIVFENGEGVGSAS